MSWQRRTNRALGRATGFELRRVSGGASSGHGGGRAGSASATELQAEQRRPRAKRKPDRLLVSPVFIFSSIRSGSTLLRVLLDSHSQLHAPHELHLRGLKVHESSKYVERSMHGIGLDKKELEHLLWDRVLHRELQKSGKPTLVNKTPGNAFMWQRVATCWPDAKYVFLLRHPAAIANSWHEARSSWTLDQAAEDALRYMNAVQDARAGLSGITVRYEDLTADPGTVTKQLCQFIGVDWEPGMLEYGEQQHGKYKAGLGDWTEKIRTGRIQPARPHPPPEEIPEALRELCTTWGYLEGASTTA